MQKELGERYLQHLKPIYQMLPMPKQYIDIIACDVYGSQPTKPVPKGAPAPATTQNTDGCSRKVGTIKTKAKLRN